MVAGAAAGAAAVVALIMLEKTEADSDAHLSADVVPCLYYQSSY